MVSETQQKQASILPSTAKLNKHTSTSVSRKFDKQLTMSKTHNYTSLKTHS